MGVNLFAHATPANVLTSGRLLPAVVSWNTGTLEQRIVGLW